MTNRCSCYTRSGAIVCTDTEIEWLWTSILRQSYFLQNLVVKLVVKRTEIDCLYTSMLRAIFLRTESVQFKMLGNKSHACPLVFLVRHYIHHNPLPRLLPIVTYAHCVFAIFCALNSLDIASACRSRCSIIRAPGFLPIVAQAYSLQYSAFWTPLISPPPAAPAAPSSPPPGSVPIVAYTQSVFAIFCALNSPDIASVGRFGCPVIHSPALSPSSQTPPACLQHSEPQLVFPKHESHGPHEADCAQVHWWSVLAADMLY